MASILYRRRYNPFPTYDWAQINDEFPSTPPEGGTSLRAGFDCWRTNGLVLAPIGHPVATRDMKDKGFTQRLRIGENRWATSVDEIRALLNAGIPVQMGTNWHVQMNPDNLRQKTRNGRREWWVVRNSQGTLGRILGGHAWTLIGASDRREAFLFPNSWGLDTHIAWISYDDIAELLSDGGEAGYVSVGIAGDRP